MTDCPNVEMRDRLPELLHEGLDASTRAAVMAHVADCQDCHVELTLLREARAILSSGIRSVDVTTIARVVVERCPGANRVVAGHSRQVNWRIAASLILFAIGGGSVVMLRGHRETGARAAAPIASSQASPKVAVGAEPPAAESVASTAGAPASQSAELSAAGGVSDLSESELRVLVNDLQTLDALPPTDPEPVTVRVAVPGSGSLE